MEARFRHYYPGSDPKHLTWRKVRMLLDQIAGLNDEKVWVNSRRPKADGEDLFEWALRQRDRI